MARKQVLLHEDPCAFMMSRLILLEGEMFQKKSCREDQNIHFSFNNIFTNIVTFMR